MGINRRQFGLLLGATLLAPGISVAKAQTNTRRPLFASAAQTGQNQYSLMVTAEDGSLLFQHPLPARAHHVEAHPTHPLLAVVGRRPERFIDLVDYAEQRLVKRLRSKEGQHFYGHAVFSPDGRYLIATENEISSGAGLITIRDSQSGYSVVEQFSSGGIGPHELKLMPDRKTLVVANGGILTHPEQGRTKLNLGSMQPSLAYIDLQSGNVLEQVLMPEPLHQLSIRHFDINSQGQVAIALQYQGDRSDDVPLVAFHRRGETLQLTKAPTAINQAMKQYCGSARFDASGQYVAISSPRGNLVTFWEPANAKFIASTSSRDGCGLARTNQNAEFLISTGRGRCYRYQLGQKRPQKIALHYPNKIAWDNHMSSLL